MNATAHILSLFFLGAIVSGQAQSMGVTRQPTAAIQIVERGPHHRVWSAVSWETNSAGRVVSRTNSYTELESGMHHFVDGEWLESEARIEVTADGAAALSGQHKVFFAANLNSAGAIDLTTPDGKQFRSHITGLSYFDSASGQAVLIAVTKDSIGELVPPNQAIYTNAFDGVDADVQYIYRKGGFEQNIILRGQPPSPANWGLNPDTTHLQVLTEFDDPPEPVRHAHADRASRIVDESLDFGEMKIGRGRAFAVGDEYDPQSAVGVKKRWVTNQGRTFLIEEVPLAEVGRQLDALPQRQRRRTAGTTVRGAGSNVIAALEKVLPSRMTSRSTGKMLMARLDNTVQAGFVIDYSILGGATNFTFRSDTTYYCTNAVNLYGTTTIEGGTVVKFGTNSGAQINVVDSILCKTGPYRPAVFTAKDDDTVGQTISGSTGSPTQHYGGVGLVLPLSYDPPTTLQGMRFIRLRTGLDCGNGGSFLLRDLQFVGCRYPLAVAGGVHDLLNVLIHDADTAFYGGGVVAAAHLTVNKCAVLADDVIEYGSLLTATNCLFVSVTNLGNYPLETNFTAHVEGDDGVFQTVAAGSHYLADYSPYRDAGTTNLSAALLNDLRTKTTYAPVTYSNITISADTTWGPQVHWDWDYPDLGYHYDPIDIYAHTAAVTNATLKLVDGVVVGFG